MWTQARARCLLQEEKKRRESLHKNAEEEGNGQLSFTPVTITCVDLCYFAPNPNKDATQDLHMQTQHQPQSTRQL